jgi:hypothetical protein
VSEPGWTDSLEVTDPTAIRLLTDLRALRFLMPFMTGAHTLTAAAAVLGRRPSTVAYWVPRMVDCGLLVHLGDIPRNGAPMPTYRAAARRLTVPYSRIPVERRVALLDEGRMQMLRRFLDGIDEALEAIGGCSLGFGPHGDRGTAVELVESDQDKSLRSYTDGWQTLRLDEGDARQMARELEAVVSRYTKRIGRSRYIVHVGLTRDPRHRWRSANDDLSD